MKMKERYSEKTVAVVILAAGLGTRMKSKRAKVLHKILGKPMIMHVVESAVEIAGINVIVVVGYQAEIVRGTVEKCADVKFAYQEKQFGTGHAVISSIPCLNNNIKNVVIICGDTPLLSAKTVHKLIEKHDKAENDVTILGVEVDHPQGYGRILVDKGGNVTQIVEEADATPEQKQIKIINSGIYCVEKPFLEDSLKKIKSNNAQKELYLTDIIEVGYREKKKIGLLVGLDSEEVIGVNSQQDLLAAEDIMKKRLSKMP